MKFKVFNNNFPLVLIRATAVRDIFNQQDLYARQNADRPVEDKYHKNWIHEDVMLVPSFYIQGNEAKVGMGRHRLTMLSRHMEEIPAAFERERSESNNMEEISAALEGRPIDPINTEIILSKIVVREMNKFEEFEYPDWNTPQKMIHKL